jgi:phosphatidylserine decarboxylase
VGFRVEVVPFLVVALVLSALLAGICRFFGVMWPVVAAVSGAFALFLCGYFLYFFRDPERTPPADVDAIAAGADGTIARIVTLQPAEFERCARFSGLTEPGRFASGPVVRISIFLSLFDVHVNRAPIGGNARFLGYFPGKHIFTFKEKSSDFNQHNSILIEGSRTSCLFNQIVGPVARRVVYWPDHDKSVPLKIGDRVGMMKFGSRLDMYFPDRDVTVSCREGDVVRAGETVIARLKTRQGATNP